MEKADSLCEWQKQDSAIAVGTLALEEARKTFGEKDSAVALVLHKLGFYNIYRAKYDIADSLLSLALSMRRELLGDYNRDVASTLRYLAIVHMKQGRLAESEKEYEKSLAMAEDILGPDHEDVASILDGYGVLAITQGKISVAEKMWKRALAIKEKTLGMNDNKTAKTMNNLAVLYRRTGKYAESVSLYKKALTIRMESQGTNHPEVARVMCNLADVYMDQGKYQQAAELQEKSLAIRESTLAPNHPDIALNLYSLGNTYKKLGQYKKAEKLYWRALRIREEVYGKEHHVVGTSLNTLGNIMVAQGKYAQADTLYRQSLEIKEKALGESHPDVAIALNNLGNICLYQGNYAQAEIYYKRSLAIREKVLDPDHPSIASSLNNLAGLYHNIGDYARAEQLYERSIRILRNALGADHPEVARGLSNLGSCYLHMGKYDRAEELLTESVSILENALGPDHPEIVESLDNLSVLYIRTGNFAEAEKCLNRSLATRKMTLGGNHPYYARSLEYMSELRRLQGDNAAALSLSRRACRIRKKNFAENGIALCERDALTYAQAVRKSVGNYFTSYVSNGSISKDDLLDAADMIISSKGQVSDEIFGRQKAIAKENDPVTQEVAESLTLTKFKLSGLFVGGPGEDIESWRHAIDSLQHQANELESKLALLSASFRKKQNRKNLTAKRVRSLLPEKSILVEYLKYDFFLEFEPEKSIPHYLVLVVARDKSPRIVDLGDSSPIDSLVSRYRKHILRVASFGKPLKSDLDEYRRIATDIYDRIWLPIEKYISDQDMIIVAPDGALNMVSFAGLTNRDGSYLIEKQAIHYLSCGRDLIRMIDSSEPGSGLFAIGDPDYDAIVPAGRAEKDKSETAYFRKSHGNSSIKRSGARNLRETMLSPLPESRKEVELIARFWRESTGEPVKTCFGKDANEACFKREAPGNRVIHLATHGYFLRNDPGHSSNSSENTSELNSTETNPLLNSGLFLAGANVSRKNSHNRIGDDGVLTAYEVSAIDLEGTDLVVLSACETGLGEIEDSEGVYGLRRAFLMAGARAIISALWPVSDKYAAETMSRVYEPGVSILPIRLQELQLETIKNLRKAGKPDHPVQWGAFTALGDWDW